MIRVLPVVIVLAILAGIAMWINRANENETTPDSGRLVYAPAKVTAVLSDNAQEDFENAEGRRVGDQELEIQILSGDHKDEIMTVTNYMSALFNVDVQQGDRIIVRIMTDENGSYYASVFNYDRGIVHKRERRMGYMGREHGRRVLGRHRRALADEKLHTGREQAGGRSED